MGERVERPGALIASPVFALSIALLLLNDHVLKAAWPGFVTGKLSDVAGVAMVAIGLSALFRHRAAAFAVTAVAFTLLKTLPVVAVLASPVLGGVTLTDPTDVAAIAVLVPLWGWVGRRSASIGTPDAAVWRTLPAQTLLVGAAVLATTATSYDCDSAGVYRLGSMDGVAYALVDGSSGSGVFESSDGGRTWIAVPVSEEAWRDVDPWVIGEPCPSGESCLPRAGSEERTALRDLDPAKNEPCWSEFFLDSVVVEQPDGEHRIETMGALGVVHRSPDGTWEWVAVGDTGLRPHQVDDEPFGIEVASTLPDDTITRVLRSLVPVMVLGAPIALALWVRPLRRLAERRGRESTGAVAVSIALAIVSAIVGVGALVFLAAFSSYRDASRQAAITVGLIWIGLAAATIVATGLYHRRPNPRVAAPPLPPPPSDQRVG